MAGLNQQIQVRLQEVPVHRDRAPVGQRETREIPEYFSEVENTIPASAIQAGRVVAQFIQDFVHLERAMNRFDQRRRPARSLWHATVRLSKDEHVVP